MPNESSGQPWEERLHQAGNRLEDEVRRVIQYINDEVVPEVRRNGSSALRTAAAELEKLANHMDRKSGPKPGDTTRS
jgi:hypothetical protein